MSMYLGYFIVPQPFFGSSISFLSVFGFIFVIVYCHLFYLFKSLFKFWFLNFIVIKSSFHLLLTEEFNYCDVVMEAILPQPREMPFERSDVLIMQFNPLSHPHFMEVRK